MPFLWALVWKRTEQTISEFELGLPFPLSCRYPLHYRRVHMQEQSEYSIQFTVDNYGKKSCILFTQQKQAIKLIDPFFHSSAYIGDRLKAILMALPSKYNIYTIDSVNIHLFGAYQNYIRFLINGKSRKRESARERDLFLCKLMSCSKRCIVQWS